MIKGSQKKSLLLRYFLTYLLVLAAPIVLFSLFHYLYTFSVLEDNIIQVRTKNLERTSDLIETQLEQLENMVIRMSYSSEFRAFVFDDEPFSAYRIIRSFGQYTMTNKFFSGAYIHFYGDNHFYSDKNAVLFDEFIDTHRSGEKKLDSLLESSEDRLFYRTDEKMAVIYNFPLGKGSMRLGKVIFLVNDDTIGNFFIDSETRYEIKTGDGSLLYASQDTGKEESKCLDIVYRTGRGMVYTNRIPEALVSADLRHFNNSFLIAVILFLLLSFPLVFGLATAQTNPITRLNDYVRKATGNSGEEKIFRKTDELQSIHDNIDSYIRKTDPALKTQIIMDFVNGKISCLDRINERSGYPDLRWSARFHTILSLVYRDGTRISNEDIGKIEWELENKGERKGITREYMLSNSLIDNKAVIIIGFDDSGFDNELNELFDKTLSRPWVLGCGTPKQSPEMMNAAYSESLRALEYGLFDGKSPIVHFGDITEDNTEELSAHISRLQKLLFEKKDIVKVEEELDALQSHLKEKATSLFQLKSLYYELLNMAVMINRRGQYPDTFEIENVTSINELIDIIHKLISQAFLETEKTGEIIPEYIGGIEGFIENNIANRQLSLTYISERFHLSSAYVSRSFKKYRNVNISQYITSLRLEMAKELLRNSTLSMQEITVSVGYSDGSSFSRLFKKQEKITPREYRAKMASLRW